MPLQQVILGLRKRGVSIRLKLRWDKSSRTCEAITRRLPIEGQVWHAKYANNEIYTLIPVEAEQYVGEWRCIYPGPGDLMAVPLLWYRSGEQWPPKHCLLVLPYCPE